ncbi:MAG TPA: CDP-alcohol phosphatidyltransferase family protein [Nitrospirota bacterium]|nr:CDP-alcohol phosphatidyltransferase family protein [Nitrospirota bacterium]
MSSAKLSGQTQAREILQVLTNLLADTCIKAEVQSDQALLKHLPNLITILRIFLIPIFVLLLIRGNNMYALGVLVAAGLSDALDGFIARTWGFKTRLGEYLDPIADKLLFVSSFVTLAVLDMIPAWVSIVIVGRDILIGITLLVLMGFIDIGNYHVRPSVLGKTSTVLQVLTILMVLSGVKGNILYAFFGVTVSATAISGLHYIYREIRSFYR